MKSVRASVILALLFAPAVWPAGPRGSAPQKGGAVTYNPDLDLAKAPADYRKRVTAFRALLRKEPDRKAKIAKALALAKNKKSSHRRDAVDFLAEVKAREAVPVLIEIVRDAEIRDEVAHALGELHDLRSVSVLIDCLGDGNENVRGNAQRALQKILGRDFAYNYADPAAKRAEDIRELRKWWEQNRATFRVGEVTDEERKAAEEAWRKYGRDYLHDLNR